jgi:glycosyltransferase involved in cell wall biosynthesis
LEIVQAFSSKSREVKLALLGGYDKTDPYQAAVLAAASDDVVFTGAVYDRSTLAALRNYSVAYLHGHQVGGTNPSLVEALGAGNAVIAHDNAFNRWVAEDAAMYFSNIQDLMKIIDRLSDDTELRERMSIAARRRWLQNFTWESILKQYGDVFANVY